MKSFSVQCSCTTNRYHAEFLPLLRRMSNLEELTLNIRIDGRTSFIDGPQIQNDILVHLPRLSTFMFDIHNNVQRQHWPVQPLSAEDIERSFAGVTNQLVACILRHNSDAVQCRVCSLPFVFDEFHQLGNTFPLITFTYVTRLKVHDTVPFEHEFFLRIAHCFPLLEHLSIFNVGPQLKKSNDSNQLSSRAKYPHLISLDLKCGHIDYVEQFLNGTKTHLSCLTELKVDYDQLIIITKHFTRDTTRSNCAQAKQLIINRTLTLPQEFYLYFPLMRSCFSQ